MSDIYNGFGEEEPVETPAEQEEAVEAAAEEALDPDFDLPEDVAADLPEVGSYVTLRTSGGDTRYVPVEGPTAIGALLAASGLSIQGSVQAWYNNALVDLNDTVPGGSTVTLIGSVKGGA
jgi:hypothetical protein